MDFMADEDLGLAKSFTKAPLGVISEAALDSAHLCSADGQDEINQAFKDAAEPNEARLDGFNFKMASSENPSAF